MEKAEYVCIGHRMRNLLRGQNEENFIPIIGIDHQGDRILFKCAKFSIYKDPNEGMEIEDVRVF